MMWSSKFLNLVLKQHRNALPSFLRSHRSLIHSNGIVLENLLGGHQGIISLAVNSPERKNALGKQAVASFLSILNEIKYNKNARVLIIHSLVKGVFSSGADLKERALMTEEEIGLFVSKIRQFITDIQDLPIPTIAAINGYALGGGLEMALACDMRISTNTAKMGLVETKHALIPGGGGTQRLARIVGPAIAKELIFTARVIDGTQAFKIGLVNHVVGESSNGDSAYNKALTIAEEILSKGPLAVRQAKAAINRGLEVDIYNGLAFEQACYAQVIGTKDRVEGLRAFKEKRAPKYTAE